MSMWGFLSRAGLAAVVCAILEVAMAAEGHIHLRVDGTNTLVRVQGQADDEWRFQTSSDLVHWTNLPAVGTVFSGQTDPPSVSVGSPDAAEQFYRAVKATGLYDAMVVRTLSLTFDQTNWQSRLAANKASGSNLVARLEMNAITIEGVGVRYRGNTSYSGMGGPASTKKSLNIEMDYTDPQARLMGYKTVNLNNAYGDETIMREPLYFNVMRTYAVSPLASLVKLYINGQYWGVYSFVQQQDGDLIDECFPSNDGDRWRAPNMAGGGGGGRPGGGGPGGGGGMGGGGSALTFLGTNLATYKANYELKSDNSTNAWERLMHATDVLNNTPTNQLRDKVEDVLAVDRWLWFLALENVFTDEDSYYFKGADYMFYYEPESGRIHPVEHDGNESLVSNSVSLSPVQGTGNTTRPVISRLLALSELRQRYLAHMRTVLEESFNPTTMNLVIDQYRSLTEADIAADTKKGFTMTTYNTDVAALKTFIQRRHSFLTTHAELRPAPPVIQAVSGPIPAPSASEAASITAKVVANGTDGLDSVWLYHRGKSHGRFTAVQMFDDGAPGDESAGDGIFGGVITSYPAGTKVRYYVEARSANAAKTVSFAPARAEQETYSYRVALTEATSTPVVINELMAANTSTWADPQGEFDDWIELYNLTDQEVDLTGRYLTDEPNNPRKWEFPAGTKIAPHGFLLVWADEDGKATPGLHASFKLAAAGESLLLLDTDANGNAVLDHVDFGAQRDDISNGRLPDGSGDFQELTPTPGRANGL